MSTPPKKQSINKLAFGKLPKRVQKAIDDIEINLSEVEDWYDSLPPVYFVTTDEEILFGAKLHFRLKKSKVRWTSIITVFLAIAGFIMDHWSKISSFISSLQF